MTTLDLMSDDLIDSDVEQGLGFFDWLLRVHTCVHNAHALRGGSKRRVHLPTSLIPSFFETEESEAGGIRMKRIGAAYRACFRWI